MEARNDWRRAGAGIGTSELRKPRAPEAPRRAPAPAKPDPKRHEPSHRERFEQLLDDAVLGVDPRRPRRRS